MADRRRPIVWSSVARADLDEIWNFYVKAASRNIADNIIRGIGKACRLLEDHPFAGRSRDEVRPGLRSTAARPHIVFYRVVNDVVEIVRIVDGRQDLDEVFAGDPEEE